MSRRYRRKSISIWCLFVLGATGVAAWHYGWLPLEFGGANTGRLVDSDSDADVQTRAAPDTIDGDAVVFADQWEPAQVTVRARTTADSQQFMPEFQPTEPAGTADPLHSTASDGPALAAAAPRLLPLPAAGADLAPDFANPIQQVANQGVETDSAGQANAAARSGLSAQSDFVEATPPTSSPSGDSGVPDLPAIDRLIEAGDLAAAHRELSQIYWDHLELRQQIRKRIEATANSLFFAPQPHFLEPYVIQPGGQLRNVAKQYSVPWEYLAKLNRVDPRKVRAGQKLKVIKGPFSAVVDLSDFELTIHSQGLFVRRYPIGTGKDGSSPTGKFTVLGKVTNPQYTDPDGNVIDGDDPTNPLGERWIDIGDGFGIHGTIHPDSIGQAMSRGCIRMRNDDVAEVYDILDVGSEVVIQR